MSSAPYPSSLATDSLDDKQDPDQPQVYNVREMNISDMVFTINEFEKHLEGRLSEPIQDWLKKLWANAQDIVAAQPEMTANFGKVADLRQLQELLREIPKYNKDRIEEATESILAKCPDLKLSQLLKVLFFSKSTILASMRNSNEDLHLNIPSHHDYLHRVLRIIAKRLFDQPSILKLSDDDDESAVSNKKDKLHQIVCEALQSAITDLLPASDIVDKHLKHMMESSKFQMKTKPKSTLPPAVLNRPINMQPNLPAQQQYSAPETKNVELNQPTNYNEFSSRLPPQPVRPTPPERSVQFEPEYKPPRVSEAPRWASASTKPKRIPMKDSFADEYGVAMPPYDKPSKQHKQKYASESESESESESGHSISDVSESDEDSQSEASQSEESDEDKSRRSGKKSSSRHSSSSSSLKSCWSITVKHWRTHWRRLKSILPCSIAK